MKSSMCRCCSNLWLVAELPQSSRCGLRSHDQFKEGDSQESQTVFWMVKMCANLLLSPVYIYTYMFVLYEWICWQSSLLLKHSRSIGWGLFCLAKPTSCWFHPKSLENLVLFDDVLHLSCVRKWIYVCRILCICIVIYILQYRCITISS